MKEDKQIRYDSDLPACIITSWNPSTAIDVAFLLLELLTTKSNAENVRHLMGF